MDSIFYQPRDIAAVPEISQLDRISRLAALGPGRHRRGPAVAGDELPRVCDAMLDIFLCYGTDWRHNLGNDTTTSQIEVFDPGHDPVVAWRLPGMPA